MPDPIIEPITIMVASSNPSPRVSVDCFLLVGSIVELYGFGGATLALRSGRHEKHVDCQA